MLLERIALFYDVANGRNRLINLMKKPHERLLSIVLG